MGTIKFMPKSMQWQIAFLIITSLSYVLSIRNGNGSSTNTIGDAYTADMNIAAAAASASNGFFPSEPLTQTSEAHLATAHVTANNFRPSQIYDFSHSEAANAKQNNYAYSQLSDNYNVKPSMVVTINKKQFSFPNEASVTSNYNYQQITSSGINHYATSTAIPAQLQTTPVITYVDPYTNENLHYTSDAANYQREIMSAPQSYTVQSSLLVGSDALQRPAASEASNSYQKYPGYVFDEQPPIYGSNNHNYHQQQREREQSTSKPFMPTPASTARRTSSTPSAISNQKISYDSHDYPPPSYSKQQTSNFVQLPQKYDAQVKQTHKQRIDYYKKPTVTAATTSASSPPSSSSLSSAAASAPAESSLFYETSYAPNYANNFGNYLQGSQQQYSENYKRPAIPLLQSPPPPPPPSYTQFNYRPPNGVYARPLPNGPANNYYQYQIGEIPPPPSTLTTAQFSYRPPYRPQQQLLTPAAQPSSGLATLASLFGSTTRPYASEFSNAWSGDGGSVTAAASNPLGSILGAFTGTASAQHFGIGAGISNQRPLNTQLIRALENIARNDDLQCVPKVLCQMIAGQTLRGQLPSFITSPAITNFLAGFPAASPALIYGRAVLLGISGGTRSCIQTYEKCPKNEYDILYYLNNHRGGFFKFFSEPDEKTKTQQINNYGSTDGTAGTAGSNSFFSILSALTGNAISTTTPRPTRRPTAAPATDVTTEIGNFFTRVLSEYLNGVEYQRRRRWRRRRSLTDNYAAEIKADIKPKLSVDFQADEEDDLDTQDANEFVDTNEEVALVSNDEYETRDIVHFPDDAVQSRILHKNMTDGAKKFFPQRDEQVLALKQQNIIFKFNREEAKRKITFPRDETNANKAESKRYRRGKLLQTMNDNELYKNGAKKEREGKRVVFPTIADEFDGQQTVDVAATPQHSLHVIFPEHIRKGRILNKPTYAPSYDNSMHLQDRFVLKQAQHKPHNYGSTTASASFRPQLLVQHYDYNESQSNDLINDDTFMNYGEYMPESTNNFLPTIKPGYYEQQHYNNPHTNYISDNRYSSGYTRTKQQPLQQVRYEDNKNVYVTNSKGILDYYITPTGQKVHI